MDICAGSEQATPCTCATSGRDPSSMFAFVSLPSMEFIHYPFIFCLCCLELLNILPSIHQMLDWLPSIIICTISFPLNKIFDVITYTLLIQYSFYLPLIISFIIYQGWWRRQFIAIIISK